MRNYLDKFYLGCAYFASINLILILVIICTQMLARWTGMTFPGATAYAGYAMANSAFFALAYTLNQDGHIRVRILLNRLGVNKKWGEIWCFAVGSFLSVLFFYYACRGAYFSYVFNDISQAEDALPMYIPQASMVIGTLVLAIAFLDKLYQFIFIGYSETEMKDDKAID
jgi:TRAP-type C4-dicarboxylate transport system permease small subunit